MLTVILYKIWRSRFELEYTWSVQICMYVDNCVQEYIQLMMNPSHKLPQSTYVWLDCTGNKFAVSQSIFARMTNKARQVAPKHLVQNGWLMAVNSDATRQLNTRTLLPVVFMGVQPWRAASWRHSVLVTFLMPQIINNLTGAWWVAWSRALRIAFCVALIQSWENVEY
jgi:hypothetical protein